MKDWGITTKNHPYEMKI